ncbi:archease [uncultured Alcanivorax sp.]|uniref:archease n=1 Tax=uncultured Alcanivorax sp. TaxID=191215 RepID=UPI003445B31E
MEFHLRDHTADIAVESLAPTLEEAFAGIAEGLSRAHSPTSSSRFSITSSIRQIS